MFASNSTQKGCLILNQAWSHHYSVLGTHLLIFDSSYWYLSIRKNRSLSNYFLKLKYSRAPPPYISIHLHLSSFLQRSFDDTTEYSHIRMNPVFWRDKKVYTWSILLIEATRDPCQLRSIRKMSRFPIVYRYSSNKEAECLT